MTVEEAMAKSEQHLKVTNIESLQNAQKFAQAVFQLYGQLKEDGDTSW